MVLRIYCIYDTKVESYSQPWFCPTNGAALRSFSDEVRNEKSNLAKHPEDYVLFELGEWDDQKGTIKMLDAKKSLGLALEYVENKESRLA